MDYTGCGNTLDMQHPRVLQLIMDSLRYWVTEMHVDGFRFDLASALARELHEVDRLGAFFDILRQDPVLNGVKLIAEPWDLGEGGYQVGNFPPGWAEWNDKYRDTMRAYWRGDGGLIGEFARRLTGSSDLYGRSGRAPHASINFVTAHDGFTLRDLVSYDDKHNEANLEDNRDGNDNNLSWNCGVEGPTDDPAILALRARQSRNLLATLLLFAGRADAHGGRRDWRARSRATTTRIARTTPLSWLDWTLDDARTQLLAFVRRVVALRRQHPVFRRRHFFEGRALQGDETKDIAWLKPDGTEMTEQEWNNDFARCLGVYLAGDRLGRDRRTTRRPVTDDDFIVLFNAHDGPIPFTLPSFDGWRLDRAARYGTRRGAVAGRHAPGCERLFASRRERSCCCRRYRRHEAQATQCRSAPISAIAGPGFACGRRVLRRSSSFSARRMTRRCCRCLRAPTDGTSAASMAPAPALAMRIASTIALRVPDPASRSNPDGVHGRSVVVDPTAYEWRDDSMARPAVG